MSWPEVEVLSVSPTPLLASSEVEDWRDEEYEWNKVWPTKTKVALCFGLVVLPRFANEQAR